MYPFLWELLESWQHLLVSIEHGEGVDEVILGGFVIHAGISDQVDEGVEAECCLPIWEAV